MLNLKKLSILLTLLSLLTLMGCAQRNSYQELELVKEVDLQPQQIKTKSLAIAFGGGGIRGYMHLGVIKALEENNIKADLVTGSSAGSVAATLYASGKPYHELEEIMNDFSEFDLMDFVLSRKGLVNGQNLADWINQSISQQKLSELEIPVGITATNMTTLESVLITDGNPGEAVQTSSSIPGAFVPVEHKENLLVDGGILNVVPVYYAKTMGADIVIGVDIYCGNQPAAEITALGMQLATFRLLACRHSEKEINSADIVVRPTYEPKGSGILSSKEAGIQAGYDAMMAKMPELIALLREH
ncbi:patatin-like phospholipase family protein [Marinomonas sp. C2222]|uniref:Patatin-like phospholipase family protein n=1 Tax=Marinomonas sargassi TaxID=2984494 RepID=A0ABT2YQR8_9GAMM|nr:patatin-like phospholipase family protein [Marinomonas sargassi]MCV2402236.1 patatin-like phospholipase family protein [Marinomonas sargassi]